MTSEQSKKTSEQSKKIVFNVPIIKDPTLHPPKHFVPDFCADTNLPKELYENQEVLAFLKLGVTQWSRIAAWTWCDYLAFEGTSLIDKERKLKKELINNLTGQAKNVDGYLNYGGDSESSAKKDSKKIVEQLLANNLEHWTQDNDGNIALDYKKIEKLTLSDVLIQTTGQPLVTSVPKNEAFIKLFYVQVTRDAFTGRVVHASDKGTESSYARYINIIAYPPRPHDVVDLPDDFKNFQDMLKQWAGGYDSGSYLPPSAYIPIATT